MLLHRLCRRHLMLSLHRQVVLSRTRSTDALALASWTLPMINLILSEMLDQSAVRTTKTRIALEAETEAIVSVETLLKPVQLDEIEY